MRTIVIIGASKGIGKAIANQQLETNKVVAISRTKPEYTHPNLTFHQLDVLTDTLPEIDQIDSLVYCPGSINLKPISSLTLQDFRNDYEINVIGAVKAIQKYLPALKKESNQQYFCLAQLLLNSACPTMPALLQQKEPWKA